MKNSQKNNLNSELSSKGKFFIVLIASGFAAFLFYTYFVAVTGGLQKYKEGNFKVLAPDYESSASKAQQVPDFVLNDRFGNKVKLSQFDKANVIILNIWASGCPVCLEEVPAFAEMDRRLGSIGNAILLTIAIDEKWEDVASYFPQGTDLRILFDPEDKVGAGIFKTKKYPETFILDKQRKIRARFDGIRPWYSDTMMEYIASFL